MLRLTVGPNGFNALPNVVSIESSACGDPAKAAWTFVNGGSTDWLPPLTVQAVENGDGGRMVYTGGNHGSSGSASGARTAANVGYQVLGVRDGASGWAESLTMLIDNELAAFNTIGQRRAVRQSFSLQITPGAVDVSALVTALERVEVLTDNALQMTTHGYQETVSFGGERMPFGLGLTSGPSATDRASTAEFASAANGLQLSWMDRAFGVGDGRYVAPDQPLIRMSANGRSSKAYHAAVLGTRLALEAGESYAWRGGYQWRAN